MGPAKQVFKFLDMYCRCTVNIYIYYICICIFSVFAVTYVYKYIYVYNCMLSQYHLDLHFGPAKQGFWSQFVASPNRCSVLEETTPNG